MSRLLARRPPASLIVSIIALAVAMSGSAVAATTLSAHHPAKHPKKAKVTPAKGDKLIAKSSLSGNRLRKHTLTGLQINLKKLGTVPKATAARTAVTAKTAKTATTAKSATTAKTATTAANANELGGQPASYYEQAAGRTGTRGIISVNGTAGGAAVQLFTIGPFSVSMTCGRNAAGQVSLTLTGNSSIAGSDLNGNLNIGAGAVTDLGPDVDIAATTAPQTANDVTMDFEAPGGAEAIVSGATGVNSLGADCWANFAGIA